MPQILESQFSDADYRLIERKKLGAPLKVYRLSRRYFLLECALGFTVSLTALFPAVLLTFNYFLTDWPHPLLLTILGLCLFFIGGVVGITTIPGARKSRLLVCEMGMLWVTRTVGYHRVRVIHWKNILTIRKLPLNEYEVADSNGRSIVISAFMYQHGEQLLAYVREQVAKGERQSRILVEKRNRDQDLAYWRKYGEWPDWLTEDERQWYENHPK